MDRSEAVPIMRAISDPTLSEPRKSGFDCRQSPYIDILAALRSNGYGGLEGQRSSQVTREVNGRLRLQETSYRKELGRLMREGLVSGEYSEDYEKGKCKIWKITDEGKKLLERWNGYEKLQRA